MQDFANTSLPVSAEPPFVVTEAFKRIFDMETRRKMDYAASLIGPVIGIFGSGTNIVNIIIFCRQGLDNTINISLFSLAISDLGSMFTLTISAIFLGPPVVNSEIPLDLPDALYLLGGWQHIWFGNITSWITVYITAERCLCVALPLKVKEIITPSVTSITMIAIYLFNILPSIPDYMYIYLDWKLSPKQNRTILLLSFRENFDFLEGVGPFVMSILAFVPFPMAIFFTVLLVVKLQQQTLWRQKSTHDSQRAQLTFKREIKTMNMVVLIAVVLIVCYIPGVLVAIASFIVPDLSVDGRYVNLYFTLFYLVFLMHAINSSVNIFLYYTMSSKFKRDFRQLFNHCICAPRESDNVN